jgi:dCTP deaminase
MILTGNAIVSAIESGEITISPFERSQVGPNSYDFRLGDRCLTYRDLELDAKAENPVQRVDVTSKGVLIEPHRIYLFNTLEIIGSTKYVPIIRGRSSIGRLGLFIDITADLIDIGSINQLTLQLHSVCSIRVFPGMLIGQVTFWCTQGDITLYKGKYSNRQSPCPSLAFREFRGDPTSRPR